MHRAHHLSRAQEETGGFDVIVVGGGATGLGAAVDAATRGYRTLLVEQEDFAKGTSSRSTKLVHGGVRYLKQMNLSLVLEALHERGLLARNARHLAHSQDFVIPSYTQFNRGFYGIGLKVYDKLAGKLGLNPSKILSRARTLRMLPNLEPGHLVGGVLYQDGQFDDSRLAVNLAQTAVREGACVLNYTRCSGFRKENGKIVGVELEDRIGGENFTVGAKAVINATGIFVDQLRHADEASAEKRVTVSQGIHLVLPRKFLPGEAAIMVPKTADGRVLFGVPWHDRVIFGTTDTPRTQAQLEPRALHEERDFVLEHAAKYLEKDPSETDILSVYAGLRPLVSAGSGTKTSSLSRDHTILVSDSGLISITGGKWTTYRKMAVDVVNKAAEAARLPQKESGTEHLTIHGSAEHLPTPTGTGDTMEVYGTDAPGIQALEAEQPELAKPIHDRLPYRRSEVLWHARHEMAQTVEDVLARRTRAVILDARAAAEAADTVADLLARELQRDEAWARQSAEHFREIAAGYDFANPASTAHESVGKVA
jgi:glycerol-3-phosphate dehydrogenase